MNFYEILGSILRFKNIKNIDYDFFENNDTFLRSKRIAANANVNRFWDQGVIPYQFEGNFTGQEYLLIRKAMQVWEKSTCVKFVPRIQDLHPKYVAIDKLSCGCCYYYNYFQTGPHQLSLNNGCFHVRTVLHELGHVIGLEHEHIRPDRDENIKIIEDNIKPEFMNDFEKLSSDEIDTLNQPYDHESIMHYPQKAFAINKTMNTLVPINGIDSQIFNIGFRKELSERDIIGTNLLYNCSVCGRTLFDPSGDFGSPNYSIDSFHRDYHCQWRIPASSGEQVVLNITSFDLADIDYLRIRYGYWNKNASARYCGSRASSIVSTNNYLLIDYVRKSYQTNNTGFTAIYSKTCGFNMKLKSNESMILESPNFPNNYEPNKKCTWCLSAPRRHYFSIKFNYFDIEPSKRCINDYIKMKVLDRFKAGFLPRECGSTNKSKIIKSNKILIEFSSNDKIQAGGFSATISTISL
ncbi:Similar to bmp1: Bone morphogenetic protein 1 (Xenopus laevis) [Cotesia congregata]|uniref:Metalloendopeptidase n=1 Tax=Cotesia congregata TaxID=51543 RepID=A0A8J2MTE7_COTCN|nr:Similar to bmp1: Bone morphogenetic protein 1 (Xenopus laevis) [Cotesia congregata]